MLKKLYHTFNMEGKIKIYLAAIGLIFAFSNMQLQAQSKGGFGIKGGLNYNYNENFFKDAQLILEEPFSNLGYHAGIFGKINLPFIYLRPELIYSNLNTVTQSQTFTTQRIDIPLLVGVDLLGSLISVFAGPSLHYRLSDDLKEFKVDGLITDFTTGYQLGVGVNLGPLGLDLRFERELTAQIWDVNQAMNQNTEFRFQQLILGLSLKF